jgi:hypothetical protein
MWIPGKQKMDFSTFTSALHALTRACQSILNDLAQVALYPATFFYSHRSEC